MDYPLLTRPLKVGPVVLKNRIVMPPMVIFMAQNDGLVSQAHLDHYKKIVGPGLVIVEGTAVLPEGRINRRQLTIHSDRHIGGFSRLAKIIHENGALAGIQLHHAGATAFAEGRKPDYVRVVSILLRLARQQFWISRLRSIRSAFIQAACRAVEAGFDIIEIHGAHGYLFSQFLSPIKNWRIDKYGRNLKNRRRLLLEVIREIQAEVEGRALVTCRLGVVDGHMGGLRLSEGIAIASILENEGMQLLDVSNGSGAPKNVRPINSPYSGRLHLAKLIKSKISIPIIGNQGIRNPELAEKALQDGMADLIAVGKGILADPKWTQKTLEGRPESIVRCRECRPCLYFSDGYKCPARKQIASRAPSRAS